jgi:site-specific DNA-methyltransferase (adenine-specific)
MKLLLGDALEEMAKLPDKSVDLFICDLPYGETNCSWDTTIDMDKFWKEFKRIRKSKRTACIHFCSTKFGYSLIKSWEKGFKMDMVWKKRNKTGGLASRFRPMRSHEMIYFFYEQAPKYNRDKYHKRVNNVKHAKSETTKEKKSDKVENEKITIPSKERNNLGEQAGIYPKNKMTFSNFEPPNPASVIEENHVNIHGLDKTHPTWGQHNSFQPPNPASIVEEKIWGEEKKDRHQRYLECGCGYFEPRQPDSVFSSEKVFIGKRNHQTEKPQDILEFFLKYWSDEGDVILDPTMGSGSTGVACKNLNREFIGIELTDKYFNVAKKRILPEIKSND